MRILRHAVLRSTQDEAKRLADDAKRPLAVRADRQTGGRGRGDKSFSSAKGGVYFSLLLPRPKIRPAELADLSLRIGAALAQALTRHCDVETAVKPPNDVLARSAGARTFKKVAGVLIEARGGDTLDWLVIGVGVNVNNRLPRSLRGAAALADLSPRRLSPETVFKAVFPAVRASL